MQVLRSLANKLRPGGRFVIELYNGEAARTLPSYEEGIRGDTLVRTRREWRASRLRIELSYGGQARTDVSEWRIYTVEEWRCLAAAVVLMSSCNAPGLTKTLRRQPITCGCSSCLRSHACRTPSTVEVPCPAKASRPWR